MGVVGHCHLELGLRWIPDTKTNWTLSMSLDVFEFTDVDVVLVGTSLKVGCLSQLDKTNTSV